MLDNKLPEIMDGQGVSIRELSRRTGITYTTIRAVYHGERRSVQLEVLEAICKALEVQPGDIYQLPAGATEGSKARSRPKPSFIEEAARPSEQAVRAQTDDWKSW